MACRDGSSSGLQNRRAGGEVFVPSVGNACLRWLDVARASPGAGRLPGGKNGVASSIVVPKWGISKWLLSAFRSFSSSKRGVIKYKIYAEKLGKSVQRQREAVGNHTGTHKSGTFTSFLGVKKFISDDVNGLICLGLCRALLEEQSEIAGWSVVEFWLVSGG